MVGSGIEKKEKKQTFRQKLKFYVTFAAASVGKFPLLKIELICICNLMFFFRNLHVFFISVPNSNRY